MLIVTEEHWLRGIDYRVPFVGITLIIAHEFQTQRSYMQALGRVGRFNEPCKRMQVQGLVPVNEESDLVAFNALMTHWREIEAAKAERANSKKAARQAARRD